MDRRNFLRTSLCSLAALMVNPMVTIAKAIATPTWHLAPWNQASGEIFKSAVVGTLESGIGIWVFRSEYDVTRCMEVDGCVLFGPDGRPMRYMLFNHRLYLLNGDQLHITCTSIVDGWHNDNYMEAHSFYLRQCRKLGRNPLTPTRD